MRHGPMLQRIPAVSKWVQVCGNKALPFWCTCRNFDAMNFITSTWFEVPMSVPLPHSLPYGVWVVYGRGHEYPFCLLLVVPTVGSVFMKATFRRRGNPALRKKMASLANFDFFTHFPKILFWETRITLFFWGQDSKEKLLFKLSTEAFLEI